jgi:hypothetical protein
MPNQRVFGELNRFWLRGKLVIRWLAWLWLVCIVAGVGYFLFQYLGARR